MENCKQTLTMRLNCSCTPNNKQQNNNPAQNATDYVDLRPLYQKFGQTLEVELQKQGEAYEAQIDELNAENFNLKNLIQRLQLRNKKDSDAEKQLRRQYNILLLKLKDKNQNLRSNPEVKIVQRIKQVKVEVFNEELPLELTRWKKRYEEVNQLLIKTKIEKQACQANNDHLKEELDDLRSFVDRLKGEIDFLKKRQSTKEQLIEKMQSQIDYLKANKEIVVETKHLFPDFKSVERVQQPQTKIETVYVEKPVEKVVFVQVVSKVKEFVRPERPLVNRIISCAPISDCNCKETEFASPRRGQEAHYLSQVVDRLEGNIKQYKNERQKLVTIIDDKNRELNSLQTQMRLFGRSQTYRGPSTVNVTVTRTNDQPISQKNSREVEPMRVSQGRTKR